MSSVDVSHVSKSFGPVKVLDDITVHFPDGGFFALLGPSGSGKTTLLRMIAGFHFPDSGDIRIGQENVGKIPVERRDVGMMFQNYALFPNLTVADNVGFGLRVRKVPASEERRRIAEALELVQLTEMAHRKPAQLSGGQQQRVALARAIVTNPRVLLLDEPLSALDKTLRVDMQFELKRIQREIGITTIFVTHDQEEALTLSDNIGILRDGRIIQSGPPREVYDHPVDSFCAGFLGEANWIPETRLDGLSLPGDARANQYAVRPEMLSISKVRPATGNAIRGRVLHRVFAGSMATSLVDVDGKQWKVIARDRDIPAVAEDGSVWLSWDPADTISVPDKLAS